MKGNPHKKLTFEDRARKVHHLSRRDRKVWNFWKRRNRKMFRKMMKQDIAESEYTNG